ncbi:MAG: FlgD immunoglobulin-like domain containing protein, partial [bacterium]
KSEKTVAQGENEDIMPVVILLHQNYPNPFNPETKIRYSLPQTNNVSLKIYNINGDIIRTLVNAKVEAGEHFIRWDGTDNNGFLVASGVYYYELMVGTFRQVNKMTLIR